MHRNNNGWILYEGPSQLNQVHIVAIVTGATQPSSNRKTGAMLQTWILNANIHPVEALQTGNDACVCGDCPLRPNKDGQRICYVNPMPLGQVYKQYRAGRYSSKPNFSLGLNARIGSYGDPTSVPISVWQDFIRSVPAATGYTRQWQQERFQEFNSFCMASCFNYDEAKLAQSLGWRTYSMRPVAQPALSTEIDCPAAKFPHQVTCNSCKLCNGQIANVSVAVHGSGKKYANF